MNSQNKVSTTAQKLSNSLVTMSLVTMILVTIATILLSFSFSSSSWTSTSSTKDIPQLSRNIATMRQPEAMAKNIEGKAQDMAEAVDEKLSDMTNK